MRNTIVHPGAANLKYEIREIVEVAKKIEALGLPITWENIGDPVEKGQPIPAWIKEHVAAAMQEDKTYGYSPTKGLLRTREYIAKERNKEGGIQITPDDILFVNGLGDAITKVYRGLRREARVIGPNPAYTTHSSAESAHADAPHITYSLDPKNGWKPDLEELESKVKFNEQIAGILIVNPDNPTGFVYDIETLKKIIDIARRYQLFIISDEIYSNLVYGDNAYSKIAGVIGAVPAIAMRGISKEFPWPGGRCGWIEFYNRDTDKDFRAYTEGIIASKMVEVCSTTLPQSVIPAVMSDARYYPYLKERCAAYKRKADVAAEILSTVPELIVHKPAGAFYMTVVFKDDALSRQQKLAIENQSVKELLESLLANEQVLDKRFIYYLLGATGICMVPLMSGFNSSYYGFRFTLLEQDEDKFRRTIETLRDAITAYLASA